MSEVKNSDFVAKMGELWHKFCEQAKKTKRSALRNFTRWVDPKLQPYRTENKKLTALEPLETPEIRDSDRDTAFSKKPLVDSENAEKPNLTSKSPNSSFGGANSSLEIPHSREDFLEILHNIPLSVFSSSQRKQLETILNLDFVHPEELMLPESRIVYVDQNEVLGPLTLDRLFRSGMKHFPVTDTKNQIIGCIHTARLNSLNIKQSSTARDILDPNVYYVREDYNLEQVLEVFLRTESYFLLVVNKYGKITGILNFTDLTRYLFGKLKNDGFLYDDDRLAVAKRHLETGKAEHRG